MSGRFCQTWGFFLGDCSASKLVDPCRQLFHNLSVQSRRRRSLGKTPARIVAAIFLALSLAGPGCGGGSGASSASSARQLQSIAASATGMTQIQLTASGAFSASPKTVTPLPVAWYVEPGVLDPPPGSVSYTLSSQPFSTACQTGSTAAAIAPQNPNAPASGSIPNQVWIDLVVNHTTTAEGGFVASPPQNIACP